MAWRRLFFAFGGDMTFQIGDQVVLPAHGVGQVIRIESMAFQGKEESWYYEIATTKSTVWVAVEGYREAGLRPIAPTTKLKECRALLRGSPARLNPDRHQRRAELAQRLRTGALNDLCEVVRDLTALGRSRPLGEADATLLRRAHDQLCEEWAAAQGLALDEASREIGALLRQSEP
jgi:CarD family transcriptional regulator